MKYGLLGSSGRIGMQVPAFKLFACSRVSGNPKVISSSAGLVPRNTLVFIDSCKLARVPFRLRSLAATRRNLKRRPDWSGF
jgi:hypothetical protein